MKPPPIFGAIGGVLFLIYGVLLVQTALFPTKNSLTKAIYWMSTILPRMGSMTDEFWMMINGIVMLLVGFLVLALWVFGVFNS
jgi:hypothetical protein